MSSIVENPRGGCVLAGINSTLAAIRGICPILHSGPGCGMQTSASEQGQSGNKENCWYSSVSLVSTNMLEKEVVFGGVDKLRTTIQGAVDIMDADTFFVLTGCTAGIIGDDIDSVCEEFQAKGVKVYPIDTPGFAGNSDLGYEKAWEALIDNVVEEGLPKKKNLINIQGIVPFHDPFWAGNLEELVRIFNKLGVEVNTFYLGDQSIENVRTSSQAALNVIVNPWLFNGPAKKYEQKFGVPSYRYPGIPIGCTDTSKFIREVSEKLELDSALVDRVIKEEEDYVYHYLSMAVGALSWKRFAVVGDSSYAVGITRYLANDYSFTPLLVIVTEPLFRKDDKQRILDQITNLEYAKAPEVLFLSDQYDINRALTGNDELTLLVGSSNEHEIAQEKGIQMATMAFPIKERLILNRGYLGYRGSLTITEDLYDNL